MKWSEEDHARIKVHLNIKEDYGIAFIEVSTVTMTCILNEIERLQKENEELRAWKDHAENILAEYQDMD